MRNLGDYQVMTTMANKVGGPRILAGLLIGCGALIGYALAYQHFLNKYIVPMECVNEGGTDNE